MARNKRGKRNGTGPFKDSYQNDQGVGKRKQAGEKCPYDKSVRGSRKYSDEEIKRGYRKLNGR